MTALLASYHALTALSAPALRLLLSRRLHAGKELAERINERRGITEQTRPTGRLLWCHGASVGESLSLLPLIDRLLAAEPGLHILVTTTTVTSARLMAERLPARAMHQFAPLDHPGWVRRFLDHWRPDGVLWIESELWPNTLRQLRQRAVPALLLNGRLSDRSFARWQRWSASARELLGCFSACMAQSSQDADRFAALKAPGVSCPGNLKFGAPPLPVDQAKQQALEAAIDSRPVWLAASTHPGEEALVLETHRQLIARYPGLLTVIAPRHPVRGPEIATLCQEQGVPHRLRGASPQLPTAQDQVYIADTLGEMGTLFSLIPLVFMGGSLVPIGGHNPIEPALFGCVVLHGPHMDNFRDIRDRLTDAGGLLAVTDPTELTARLDQLLREPSYRQTLGEQSRIRAEAERAVLDRVFEAVCARLPVPGTPQGEA